jgi:hypothetical protein
MSDQSIGGAACSEQPRNDADAYAVEASAPLPPPVPRRLVKRQRDQRLRRVTRQLRKVAPHLDNVAFAPILQGFARVSVLLSDSYEKIKNQNLLGEDGELRPSIETIRRLVDTQAKLAEKLGLTPATLKALRREKKADIAAAFANLDDAD